MADAKKIDRSKFKATSVAVTKQADQEVEALAGRKKGGVNADYLNVKDGSGNHNYRIFPPHPADGGELYAVAKGVHWLPREVPKKDDKGNFLKVLDGKGNPIPGEDGRDKLILEWKDSPIFNAKIHGGQEKDIIEEYIAFAQKIALDNYTDEKERKKFLAPIIGGFGSEHNGILLRQTWVMYVNELLEGDKLLFGRLEIGKAVKDRLNKISASESSNEPLGTDPFTDLDEGRAVNIKYDKNATKAQDYYTTEIYAPLVKGGKGQITLFPITDEDLEKFQTYPSLKKMFISVYNADTFDMALKGLKKFDEDKEIGVFAYEEFMDIADQLLSKLPEGDGPAKKDVVEEEEQSGDEFDKMDRDELKDYNRENKLGIIPTGKMNDDQFRQAIRDAIEIKSAGKVETVKEEVSTTENDLPWDKEGKDLVKKETVAAADVKTGTKLSVADRLNKLKKK